jgi:putative ABC transport system ATP-binding protein
VFEISKTVQEGLEAGPYYQTEKPLIQLRQVVKTYPTNSGEYAALNGIDVEFYPGEFAGILGKSGAGKSTLVNMITGVDELTSGEVWFAETPIHALNEDQKALWRGRSVGVVYQTFQLMPSLSLVDNILLPMEFCGLYQRGKSEARALELLRAVELEDHAFKKPSAISGGQQQRVAIARALANDPPVIVADEPTGNLDSATADAIFQLFEGLVAAGKTVIMVSHDPGLKERASRLLTLVDGELAEGELSGDRQQAEQPAQKPGWAGS